MATATPSSINLQDAEESLRRLTAPQQIITFWSPPEDLDKPRLSYIPGFTVQIRRHVPPPPFGGPRYGRGTRKRLSQTYLREITQSKLVIEHPGPGAPLPALSEMAQLTVVTPISIGEVRGAQVVACEIFPQNKGDQPYQAVAKIYDPMYYHFEFDYNHRPRDTVWQADSDYSREAAAYEHLQQKNMTSFAPQYFGSWTLDLPITSRRAQKTRPVRIILIEQHDANSSMWSMCVRNNPDPQAANDAFHCPEDFRLEVLAVAMDGYVRMLHSGLDQNSFTSRNIMLSMSAKSSRSAEVQFISGIPLPRVVLVDYHASVVYDRITGQGPAIHPQYRSTSLPINPMQLWWELPMNEFVGWVPHEWHSTPRLKREWLQKRLGGTEQGKLYTMDKGPQFENDEMMEDALTSQDVSVKGSGSRESTDPVATKSSAAHSRPQNRTSGSHGLEEDVYNAPVLLRYLPWNPRSDEIKRLKAQRAKKEKR